MARIKDEIIEKLKNEVSLVRLMESQGFELNTGQVHLTMNQSCGNLTSCLDLPE